MAWTVPAHHCFLLRVARSKKVLLSAFCTGQFKHHNQSDHTSDFPSPLSSGQYDQPFHSSVPFNDTLDSTNGCGQPKTCSAHHKVLQAQQAVSSSSKSLLSSSIQQNCGILAVPSLSQKLTASSLTASCLTHSKSFYHQTPHFHSHMSHRSGSRTASKGSNINISHHPLLRQRDFFQSNHPSIGNFSTTRLILEASPQSLQPYLRLIRFDKPIGNWLLYWPCTWSIALAADPGCMPDLKLLAMFGAGAFFMRGAGCIINDMWDKDIDAKVERTKMRPLASGEISLFQALVFLSTQLSCALAILFQLNNYSIALGASSLGLVVLYPLAKRYTYWPQVILGLTLNWGVLLAWSALRGSVELPGLILYLACTLYTTIYDTIYSHQDKYDDMLIGVKSTALRLGDQTKPCLSVFTAVMAGGLVTSGYICDMTWPYYVAVGLTGGRLLQQLYSVNLNNADDCANAFRGNFYLGAVMFIGIVLANFLKSKQQEESLDGTSASDKDTEQKPELL